MVMMDTSKVHEVNGEQLILSDFLGVSVPNTEKQKFKWELIEKEKSTGKEEFLMGFSSRSTAEYMLNRRVVLRTIFSGKDKYDIFIRECKP